MKLLKEIATAPVPPVSNAQLYIRLKTHNALPRC